MKKFTVLLLFILPALGFAQVDLPITFEDTATVDYMLSDFGGNSSMIVVDPTDSTNLVGQATKNGPEIWAGTTNGGNGLANPIPFSTTDTKMSVRVWSPTAGTPIRLKAEKTDDGGVFAEVEVNTTMAGMWETLEFDFANPIGGSINLSETYGKVSIFFDFGTVGTGQTYYWDDITFIGGGGFTKTQVDLPITFEDTATVEYALADFGGNASMIVVDPTDATNLVGQATKNGPEIWAGTTNGGAGLASPIPFTSSNTMMTVRVWSPTAGTPIRLKVEDAGDPTISVETEAITTVAMEWEMLTFDFSQQVDDTAPLNVANTYDKVSIFFNFGTVGTGITYYWDDIMFVSGGGSEKMQIDLPITFEDTATVDYALADFGGNASMIVVDPTNENNIVVQAVKNADMTWAGTTVGSNGLVNQIPFDEMNTIMTVRVWSPTAGIPIRLKAENTNDGGIFVETERNTTVASEWETLEFDFADPAGGSLNFDNDYGKVSIFFDFGTVGEGQTYYFDDIIFAGGGGSDKVQVDLPITFEDTASVEYALADFGGNSSMIVVDPTDATNLVGQATKNGPEPWAGTVIGGSGLANPINFTADNTKMSVRVWSPTAGTPILLKVENAVDGGIFAETQVNTTVAEAWETLEFDLSTPSNGVFDLANTYDKIAIFFNFGTVGTGEIYYWDDMFFLMDSGLDVLDFEEAGITVAPNPASNFLNVKFEEDLGDKVTLGLFDSNGRLVLQERINGLNTQLEVNDLSTGIYYMRINTADKTFVQKVSIAK